MESPAIHAFIWLTARGRYKGEMVGHMTSFPRLLLRFAHLSGLFVLAVERSVASDWIRDAKDMSVLDRHVIALLKVRRGVLVDSLLQRFSNY